MKSAVVTFPASNCNRDMFDALEKITGKTPIENFQKLLIQKVDDNKIMDLENKSITKKTIIKKDIAKKSSEFYRLVANLYSKENSNP